MSTLSTTSPSPPPFPTTLSDLTFNTTQSTSQSTIYKTLSLLRKSTLSIPNRLISIIADSLFITQTVHVHFPDYPLIANERCGSWYIPPELKGGSAYFKSTDGHYGQWAFSLRRLNLQLLTVLGEFGGAVLVDSTRRGKRLPDALRRTVPVWVVVWNRVLFSTEEERGRREGWWFVEGDGLEDGEVKLIEMRIEGWIDGVKGLGLDLNGLRGRVGRPIRCVWIVNGEEIIDCSERIEDVNTLALCSASRKVVGAEMSEDGYIQGAGDDNEVWSCGLTPNLFWKHKDQLMDATDGDLEGLIDRLVADEKAQQQIDEPVLISPTKNLYLSAGCIDNEDDLSDQFNAAISCNGTRNANSSRLMQLGCRSAKSGSRDLREVLGLAKDFVHQIFKRNNNSKILVVCDTGKDLSVGVVVMILCMYFEGQGHFASPTNSSNMVDKNLVKQRLAWITSCKSDANPSRSTLQAVNSFMIGRPP